MVKCIVLGMKEDFGAMKAVVLSIVKRVYGAALTLSSESTTASNANLAFDSVAMSILSSITVMIEHPLDITRQGIFTMRRGMASWP